jgi:hypothetical protein
MQTRNHGPLTTRPSADAGIAIGPILFVIALLGIIAAVIAAGSDGFGTATIADRIYNDVYSQANLIRTKINECNIKYGTNENGDGFPPSNNMSTGDLACSLVCLGDPANSESGNDCEGNAMTSQNLWYGIRPTTLPPPSAGMGPWSYINDGAAGGRCIWAQPTTPNSSIGEGLTHAATKFSSQEIVFNGSGTTQRFVIWITYPTGTPDTLCTSP